MGSYSLGCTSWSRSRLLAATALLFLLDWFGKRAYLEVKHQARGQSNVQYPEAVVTRLVYPSILYHGIPTKENQLY